MRLRGISLWALSLIIILLSGCNTAGGATKGVACGIKSTAEGVGKDSAGLFNMLMSMDNWIKKNLW